MFKNRLEGFLFSPESDASGGSSGDKPAATDVVVENNDQASGEKLDAPAVKTVEQVTKELTEQYEARIAALDANNKALLAEKKAIKESVDLEKKKKAEDSQDYPTLLEIERNSKKEELSKREQAEIERDQYKERLAEKDRLEVRTLMFNKFKEQLGAELYDPTDAFSKVNFKLFAPDPATGEFNVDGMKMAINEFIEKYPHFIKPSGGKMPGEQPKTGGEVSVDSMSVKDALKAAGML